MISPHDRLAFHLFERLDAVRGLARCQRRGLPDHARQSRLRRRARRLADALTDLLDGTQTSEIPPAAERGRPDSAPIPVEN
jgi:hypothetical protein